MDILCKVNATIVLQKLEEEIQKKNVLPDIQTGLRKERNIVDNSDSRETTDSGKREIICKIYLSIMKICFRTKYVLEHKRLQTSLSLQYYINYEKKICYEVYLE